MSSEGYAGPDEPAPQHDRRPALYPWVGVPAPLGAIAGTGLLAAVTLAVVQAVLRVVLTYGLPSAEKAAGVAQFNPYSGFAAKLAVFSTNGAGLTVAVMLLVAVVVLAASGPGTDALGPPRYARALARAVLVLAVVVVVANGVAAVEVLANSQGALQVIANQNRAASVLGFLSPLVVAAGAGLYVAARLRRGLAMREPADTAQEDPTAPVE